MTDHIYSVTARRDGKWWYIHVPELDVSTQSRKFSDVDMMAKDVIGLVLDVDPETIEVDTTFGAPLYATHVPLFVFPEGDLEEVTEKVRGNLQALWSILPTIARESAEFTPNEHHTLQVEWILGRTFISLEIGGNSWGLLVLEGSEVVAGLNGETFDPAEVYSHIRGYFTSTTVTAS